jgi:hypothetical protein
MLPGLIQVVGGMVQASGYTPTGVEVTPTMTSNTAPSGYTASGNVGAGAAWNCFDKSSGQDYGALWNPPGTAATLQLLLPSTVYFASYSIQYRTGAGDGTQAPNAWTFQYTADGGSNWSTADIRTGITGWSADEVKTYTITTPIQGNGFKIVGTANNGSGAWYAIKEVRVYS